jgi:hypothetical protein
MNPTSCGNLNIFKENIVSQKILGIAPVTTFVEEGYRVPTREECRIPDPLWNKVLPFMIKTCIDALLWCKTFEGPKVLYGVRKNAPARGERWYVGGGPKPCTGAPQEELCHLIKRETGLTILPERIPEGPSKLNYMRWRESVSELGGAADYSNVFFVEITEDEARAMIQFAAEGRSPEFHSMGMEAPNLIVKAPTGYTSVFQDTVAVLIHHLRRDGLDA